MDDNNNLTNGENPIDGTPPQNVDPNAGGVMPNAGYTDPNAGYANPNAGYTNPNAGYANPNAGYTDPNAGYANPNAGYTDPNAGYYAAPGGYDPNGPATYAPVHNPYVNEIPAEVRKWNWGAFALNVFWGIGNHAYLSLLCLIPYFNFVWMFICGAMGNRWAWKSGEFKDLETFLAVQKTWNRAGIVAFIAYIVLFVAVIIITVIIGISAASILSGGYSSYY
jgi:hypothetical protein